MRILLRDFKTRMLQDAAIFPECLPMRVMRRAKNSSTSITMCRIDSSSPTSKSWPEFKLKRWSQEMDICKASELSKAKLNIILFLICWRKKFGPIFQELWKFLPKTLSPSPQKYGFGIGDPRSGIRKKAIPDPGSRGQKGTGSRIRIRNTAQVLLVILFRDLKAADSTLKTPIESRHHLTKATYDTYMLLDCSCI